MKVVLVYSGKGGVGKSTTATHLASILSKQNTVFLYDGDYNSPSISYFFRDTVFDQNISLDDNLNLIPAKINKLYLFSCGLTKFNSEYPIIHDDYIEGLLQQSLYSISRKYDYLIVDLPPGFNKIHYEIFKRYNNSYVILVTDSSKLCLADSSFGVKSINKLGVKIDIIINNFSDSILDESKEGEPLDLNMKYNKNIRINNFEDISLRAEDEMIFNRVINIINGNE